MAPESVTVMEVTQFLVVVVPTDDAPVVEDSVYLCAVPVRVRGTGRCGLSLWSTKTSREDWIQRG